MGKYIGPPPIIAIAVATAVMDDLPSDDGLDVAHGQHTSSASEVILLDGPALANDESVPPACHAEPLVAPASAVAEPASVLELAQGVKIQPGDPLLASFGVSEEGFTWTAYSY